MSLTPAMLAALDRVTDPLEPLLDQADLLIDQAVMELAQKEVGAAVDCLEQLRELLGRIGQEARPWPAAQPEQRREREGLT